VTPFPISDVSRARAAYTIDKGNPITTRHSPDAPGGEAVSPRPVIVAHRAEKRLFVMPITSAGTRSSKGARWGGETPASREGDHEADCDIGSLRAHRRHWCRECGPVQRLQLRKTRATEDAGGGPVQRLQLRAARSNAASGVRGCCSNAVALAALNGVNAPKLLLLHASRLMDPRLSGRPQGRPASLILHRRKCRRRSRRSTANARLRQHACS
jgi:hypothetical protein